MNWLSPDSKFMEAWNNTTDGILINLLMLLTSVPLVTIGAALAAGNETARKMLQGEGNSVVRTYWASYKSNLGKATLLWLPYLLTGITLVGMWAFLHEPWARVIEIFLSIMWVLGFEWTFAVQARFDNTVARTWLNAFVFALSNPLFTALLIIIDVAFIFIIVGTVMYLPPALFLVIVFGYGSMLMLHVPFTERAFSRYIQ
ncbi:MAG: YesL family protein [Alloscardovia omnicolens]|uniref:YesL family protein n=1 Tax=Alloscardovia omnicolens TaxID=419015 RepID=UPI00242D2D8A|nr:YesL family protein [Alloscardovia omnicolens]MBS6346044.1 YesL family protein [Alloscardovia omnicolens]